MILGNSLIWFALAATAAGMLAYASSFRIGLNQRAISLARGMTVAAALALVAAAAWLWYLILTHQFQFDYVYRYSSLDMPMKYIISCFWGGQEGTFLLWATYGALFSILLSRRARQYEAAVNFFYMGITLFLLLMLVKASPFSLLPETPADGNGLNPLLQDPWMTIHPPIMFLGFASLGIPAAFAMAALVKEDWDNWIPRAMPWTLLGVVCLGTGLTLGGYWSYSILGWGGYWGWDPVENSSLVPWLFSITLLHTQLLQLRRNLFRRANLMLSIIPFLTLTYSTFLTRSGVLADFSVHSFTDLGINQFLAAFMFVFLVSSVVLFAWKFRRIPVEKGTAPVLSRDYFMFLGALSFGLFGLFVCLGTSAPLITRLWGPASNVEPEFYNRIGLPFTILIALLVSVAPHLSWNRALAFKTVARRLRWPVVGMLLVGVASWFWGLRYGPYLAMTMAGALALFANASIVLGQMRKKPKMAGGYVAHVGLGFLILGVLLSTTKDKIEVIELPKDQEVQALGYSFKYLGDRPVEQGRKDAFDVQVTQGSKSWMLSPTMYYSEFNAGMMKKPAIRSRLTHDIYVAPGGVLIESVEDRVKRFLHLHKNKPQSMAGMGFTFKAFETSSTTGGTDHNAVTAVIEITHGDAVHEIRPAVHTHSEESSRTVPAELPGSSMVATLDGIDATNGVVRLGISDPSILIGQGHTVSASGMDLTVHSYDVDMGSGRGNKLAVYAHVTVAMGPDTLSLKPGVIHRANMDPVYEEARLGDTGLNLVLAAVHSSTREAEFYITRPPREALWVEASTKPFIQLLWIGTALVVLGVVMATVMRTKLAERLAREWGEVQDRKAA